MKLLYRKRIGAVRVGGRLLRVPEHINLALVEPSVYTQVPNGRPSDNENNLKCFFSIFRKKKSTFENE